jgi:hypothetical protein
MILHIFESGRHAAPPKLWAGWSAAAHAALVAGVVGGAYVRPAPPPAVDERARYLLPRLPGAAPRGAAPVERLQWVGLGGRPAPRGVEAPRTAGPPAAAKRATSPAESVAPPTPELLLVAADTGDTRATPLYLEDQVDVPVARDATSEGPQYPDSLQAAGVEGSVTAEWVVDTAGRPDSATFHPVEATHPLFEQGRARGAAAHAVPAGAGGRGPGRPARAADLPVPDRRAAAPAPAAPAPPR